MFLRGIFNRFAPPAPLATTPLGLYTQAMLSEVSQHYRIVTPAEKNPWPDDIGMTKAYNELRSETGGWHMSRGVIGLPERRGLAARFAKRFGLNPKKLSAAGIDDDHLFADTAVHEMSHLMEEDEPAAYALHTARLAMHSGPEEKAAVKFATDAAVMMSLLGAMRRGRPDNYSAIAPAISLAQKRLHTDPAIWDAEADCFSEKSFLPLQAAELPDGPAFSKACDALGRQVDLRHSVRGNSRDISYRLQVRDAALTAGDALAREKMQNLASNQYDDRATVHAGQLLHHLANAIDGVMQYSDGYYPPVVRQKAMPNPVP